MDAWLAWLPDGPLFQPLVLLLAGAAGAVAWRLAAAAARRVAPAGSYSRAAIEAMRHPGRVLGPIVGMVIVRTAASLDLPDASSRMLTVTLILGLAWSAVRLVRSFVAWVIFTHPLNVSDNLSARRIHTQTEVLARAVVVLIVVLTSAAILMTFPGARQFGTSLLASAGAAGLVIGFAAKPVLANLIAGIQIALSQPIRIDDVVIVEKEWGRIEEIGGTYVVVRLWDERRLVVPLNYFLEHPFENWTRTNSSLLGTAQIWADYRIDVQSVRAELERICQASPLWDRRTCLLQVTEVSEYAIALRALVSAADSGRNFDLRCEVREGLVAFINRHQPQALPRRRNEQISVSAADLPARGASPVPRPMTTDGQITR
ncbi:mechanosensitive ion channel family protein [Tahibacter amnicola]|uniref:Mechanosensitive ion channel family protein n=1 Tax=Tahibacter amnicola TaxID=2976241 RepID=A0ABY6B8Z2_9GAMM|nr:mechanosensitive ion channel family protein [Tahibacter amnicola]UXI66533.1 mechanosensitive ion channel family protein [Tahibacter amnicola]